jgi:hypothetical protein
MKPVPAIENALKTWTPITVSGLGTTRLSAFRATQMKPNKLHSQQTRPDYSLALDAEQLYEFA